MAYKIAWVFGNILAGFLFVFPIIIGTLGLKQLEVITHGEARVAIITSIITLVSFMIWVPLLARLTGTRK